MPADLLRLDILVPVLMYCALLWWIGRGLSWPARLGTAGPDRHRGAGRARLALAPHQACQNNPMQRNVKSFPAAGALWAKEAFSF